LHDEADKPIFATAIIVTDRVVLDRQLQGTVAQFEQTAGVVKKIDGTSRQLKDAIESNARIIITTIQKFSTEHLKTISGQGSQKFAILIDEAHGSQSGKSAQALSETLTREEATGSEDIEDLIAKYQRERGPPANWRGVPINFARFDGQGPPPSRRYHSRGQHSRPEIRRTHWKRQQPALIKKPQPKTPAIADASVISHCRFSQRSARSLATPTATR
jgi:SWI2/SNF2 ATPase